MKKYLVAAAVLIVAAGAAFLFVRYAMHDREVSPLGGEAMNQAVQSAPQMREMDLFFADSTGRRLSLERREIKGENRDDLLKRVVEALIRGPEGEDRVRTLPEATLVRAVFTREQTVWVDLGGAIQEEHPGGAWTEVLSVYSVVNTLTENFPEVSSVQLLLNGRESETFAGHVDISKPLVGRIQLLAGDWE